MKSILDNMSTGGESMVNLLDLPLEEITDIEFNCSCGQYHEVDIGDIRIGKAILGEIPEILSSYKGKRLLLVADRNTYQVVGQQVIEIIEDQFIFRTFIYEEDYLIADAKS